MCTRLCFCVTTLLAVWCWLARTVVVERVDAVVAPAAVDATWRPPDHARFAELDLHVLATHLHRLDVASHCQHLACLASCLRLVLLCLSVLLQQTALLCAVWLFSRKDPRIGERREHHRADCCLGWHAVSSNTKNHQHSCGALRAQTEKRKVDPEPCEHPRQHRIKARDHQHDPVHRTRVTPKWPQLAAKESTTHTRAKWPLSTKTRAMDTHSSDLSGDDTQRPPQHTNDAVPRCSSPSPLPIVPSLLARSRFPSCFSQLWLLWWACSFVCAFVEVCCVRSSWQERGRSAVRTRRDAQASACG